MDIAVVGPGGVGGYFGGLLAKAGNNVTFMARGQHLEAIKANGLRVSHQEGEFTLPVRATDDPGEAGPVELVIFTVKTYDTEDALPLVKALMGPETAVLTLQNGVESYQVLGRALGEERVLPGAAYIESGVVAPGHVRQMGDIVRIVLGEVDGSESPRSRKICEALRDGGINNELSPDVLITLWTKFLFIASLAGVTSACRRQMGLLLEDPAYRGMLVSAMEEIEAVARARGVGLDPQVVPNTMAYIEGSVKDLKASMHTDLEMGRRLELEALNGAVVRLGREAGAETPVNNMLYLVLKPYIGGAA
jgi:2-dehydropantoate 2-reductase